MAGRTQIGQAVGEVSEGTHCFLPLLQLLEQSEVAGHDHGVAGGRHRVRARRRLSLRRGDEMSDWQCDERREEGSNPDEVLDPRGNTFFTIEPLHPNCLRMRLLNPN